MTFFGRLHLHAGASARYHHATVSSGIPLNILGSAMSGYKSVFVSYASTDRAAAAHLRDIFERAGFSCFMAHEDIEVSEEWRARLVSELNGFDVFVALLSEAYLDSTWCIQEAGVAACRTAAIVWPLSVDGIPPPGLLGSIQAVRLDLSSFEVNEVASAFMKRDAERGRFTLISMLANSHSFRNAERNFAAIEPYLTHFSASQDGGLVDAIANNEQVNGATKCEKVYIASLMTRFPSSGSRIG